MGISSIINRIKKGVRDVGSGAKDILKNNPEALMIAATMFGLPYLMNKTGTTTGGGGFMDWMGKFGRSLFGRYSPWSLLRNDKNF